MNIQALTLGPMHCSIAYEASSENNKHRFWGLGKEGTVGVIRIRKKEDATFSETHGFSFSQHYHYTGIVDILLKPDCYYIAQMGCVQSHLSPEQIANQESLNWDATKKDTFEFKTFPKPNTGQATKFILGSCRHQGNIPISFLNSTDSAFKSISKRIIDKENPDFILMTGDQVYADHFYSVIAANKPPKAENAYFKRYFNAFNKKYFRKTLARLPAYMILDDHEVQNDFSIAKFKDDTNKKYAMPTLKKGLLAYQSFQANMSPVIENAADLTPQTYGENGYEGEKYDYTFSHGHCAFFVMDVRCEREAINTEMISTDQEQKLFQFLEDTRNKKQFVVSPVPFFPDTKKGKFGAPEDKWAGYGGQRDNILKKLKDENYNNVVFLSGDVHCSFTSTITVGEINVHSIISSAFNWFILGLGRKSFRLDGLTNSTSFDPSPTPTMLPKRPIKKNNYAVITVENNKVTVIYYGTNGKPQAPPIVINL